ncbi:MAG: hypothetical protein JJU00_08995 [Opitutales bacterium]|nr:hypothetical protein [Opitutales bacterium]
MKKTTLTILGGFLAASTGLMAQTAPNAMVDENGNLVINPGEENEMTIAPPAGEVDGEGNLVIDGTTINRPQATVLADGSLDLGDGTVLQVPDIGVSPNPADGFFMDLYEYGPELAGWFYSPVINHFWNQQDGWIFWEDWGITEPANGWFFINTEVGNGEAFWTFSNHFNSWAFFEVSEAGFKLLSDANDPQQGWFYVIDPLDGGSNWHFLDQYIADWTDPAGQRVAFYSNDDGATWVRLR